MSSCGSKASQGAEHLQKERKLMLNTIQVLDDEKENILSEILRCYICLDLPKGKQVKVCEQGHHCCLTCSKKIKYCGICRGAMLKGRNFVVEQLVNKLSPILGLSKPFLPSPEPPKPLPPGLYPCPHHCPLKCPSDRILPHIRAQHSNALLDNVRSDPYSGHFSFRLNALFVQNEHYVFSAQVSDMGLFTTEVRFSGLDLCGCVRMLAEEAVAGTFRYQLMVQIEDEGSESVMEFGVKNCPVGGYLSEIENGKSLKVKGEHLKEYVEEGRKLVLYVSVWEKGVGVGVGKGKDEGMWGVGVGERVLELESDRRTRRNRNRNKRRKKNQLLLKSGKSRKGLVEKMSRLTL